MSFAEKLMELRKQKGWSQEELGDKLGVTRQTVSKWELGATTPEMEKLAAISDLFGITTDELIKGCTSQGESPAKQTVVTERKVRGYTSKRTWRGMPLVHIAKNAKGVVAIGLRAKGIISIGLMSMGLVSIGLLSLGIISFGCLALGAFVCGTVAAGVFALGGAAAGVFALGGVAFGWVSFGGVSCGTYAIGGFAKGQVAVGGIAEGVIAVGDEATGEIVFGSGVTAEEFRAAVMSRFPNTPKFIADWMSWFASNVT
ncbi:MAG: helix-turn-helix domain-containing protein [Oscillospiraceae bacterium]|nr:helix-turn-helix domain-containing protein [Oscillospiraceae bacterium]